MDFLKQEDFQKIYYLECDKQASHEGEALNVLCIDKKCNQNGLICPICENENHKDHQVVPLKFFLQSLQKSQNMLVDDHNS